MLCICIMPGMELILWRDWCTLHKHKGGDIREWDLLSQIACCAYVQIQADPLWCHSVCMYVLCIVNVLCTCVHRTCNGTCGVCYVLHGCAVEFWGMRGGGCSVILMSFFLFFYWALVVILNVFLHFFVLYISPRCADTVFSLDASDDYLKQRVMNLPESEVTKDPRYGEEGENVTVMVWIAQTAKLWSTCSLCTDAILCRSVFLHECFACAKRVSSSFNENVCVRACVRVCVFACVRACVRTCVCIVPPFVFRFYQSLLCCFDIWEAFPFVTQWLSLLVSF